MDADRAQPLKGRRAFILGGTGGLGKATAYSLGLRGAVIDLHGGSEDKLSAALKHLRVAGIQAEGTAGLIASLADAVPLRKRIEAADILVVSWGPFLQKPLHDTTFEDWERTVSFNLALPGSLVSTALPGMRQRAWGRILLFGGTRTDGIRGYRTNAAYAAAKTGLGSLAKSIAAEYARDGVAALVLCPGFAQTEYLDKSSAETLAEKTPQGRLIEPGAFGEFAADLLSYEFPLWNGAVISADEGLFSW